MASDTLRVGHITPEQLCSYLAEARRMRDALDRGEQIDQDRLCDLEVFAFEALLEMFEMYMGDGK